MALTTREASQALAPLLTRAWASESEEAMTKKLAQPTPRSNSFHERTPMPGASRQIQASRAGSAGWRASVSHSSEAPAVMRMVRHSTGDRGRRSGSGVAGKEASKPLR